MFGWVFDRHKLRDAAGATRVTGKAVLWISGVAGLVVFAVVRGFTGYGTNVPAPRRRAPSWQQWLVVSQYPPSLTFAALELRLLFSCLATLRVLEPRIGVRQNGVFYMFGQASMFFYLVHRLALEIPATYFGCAARARS